MDSKEKRKIKEKSYKKKKRYFYYVGSERKNANNNEGRVPEIFVVFINKII